MKITKELLLKAERTHRAIQDFARRQGIKTAPSKPVRKPAGAYTDAERQTLARLGADPAYIARQERHRIQKQAATVTKEQLVYKAAKTPKTPAYDPFFGRLGVTVQKSAPPALVPEFDRWWGRLGVVKSMRRKR